MVDKIILDYIKYQEKKIAEMKERVRLLSKAIPEIEVTLKEDKKNWGIEEV